MLTFTFSLKLMTTDNLFDFYWFPMLLKEAEFISQSTTWIEGKPAESTWNFLPVQTVSACFYHLRQPAQPVHGSFALLTDYLTASVSRSLKLINFLPSAASTQPLTFFD